jgi:hypothetical protein
MPRQADGRSRQNQTGDGEIVRENAAVPMTAPCARLRGATYIYTPRRHDGRRFTNPLLGSNPCVTFCSS